MKVKQTLWLLTALVFSFVASGSAREEKKSIMYRKRSVGTNALQSSSDTITLKHRAVPEKIVESSTMAPSRASSSFSALRRELKRDVAMNFKQCFDVCTNSSTPVTPIQDNCCVGGVGFLKLKFHAHDNVNGTITIGSEDTCVASQNRHKVTKAGTHSNKPSTSELRLVDCKDICVQKPFGGHPCNAGSVVNAQHVMPGSDICIAMVRPTEKMYEYEVVFDQKMEHNLHILFWGNAGLSVGVVHTSCSKPLTTSWGVVFGDCDHSTGSGKKKYEHIEINDNMDKSTPYLSFVDGISTEYFTTAIDALSSTDTTKYARAIDIGFNDCGCTCEPTNITTPNVDTSFEPSITPSLSPSTEYPSNGPTLSPSTEFPSNGPTLSPSTEYPTFFPTMYPTPTPTIASTSTTTFSSTSSDTSRLNRGPGFPTSGPTCSSECSAFVLQHCVFVGTNTACDMRAPGPIVADDDDGEGAAAAPLPHFLEPKFADDVEFVLVKGSKGSGKNGHGKQGKKSTSMGKGSEHSRKKGGNRSNKLTKHSKGKGRKGRLLASDSEYQIHLQKIKYHQSRIDYLQNLLLEHEI